MMSRYPLVATLPAADIDRARTWYEEKLGLVPVKEFEQGLRYESGGVNFELYPSSFAGTAQNTAAGFAVDDVEAAVDELAAKGVVFEQYDFPGLKTNEKGIATFGSESAAWFKDSEGNILSVSTVDEG
jgi:catechol 2,3-dioxygenase-like lactoylglutathione lyase family enzyme